MFFKLQEMNERLSLGEKDRLASSLMYQYRQLSFRTNQYFFHF